MGINPKFLRKICHELTPDERNLVQSCLGCIPTGEPGDLSPLWKRFEAGELFYFQLTDPSGGIAGFSIFGFSELPGGKRDLVSYATATIGNLPFDCTQAWDDHMTAIARELYCDSISLKTCRAGLALKLTQRSWAVTELVLRREVTRG